MAENAEKTRLANRAIVILNAGSTSQAGVLLDLIDDSEFADYATVSESDESDKRLICFLYEQILKQVIEDMDPDFCSRYADLGQERKINQEDGGWNYLFELPSDFLIFREQVYETDPTDPSKRYRARPQFFRNYSHVVIGSDSQYYYCSTNHVSQDDSDDGQPPDDDGNANWTLDTDLDYGATWDEEVTYSTGRTAWMLCTNDMSNEDGDSAYIRYSAYVQEAIGDEPEYYSTLFENAFCTRLAAEMALDGKDYERRRRLLEEYEALAKQASRAVQQRQRYRPRPKTALQRRLTG